MSLSPSPAVPDRTRVPADVDRPDEILAGLTARQLGVLLPPLLLSVAVFWTGRPYLPTPLLIVLCVPPVGVGAALALGRRAGLPLDRYAAAAYAHRRTPAVQAALPATGPAALPGWMPDVAAARTPAPASALAADVVSGVAGTAGVVDLGDAVAVIAEVDTTNIMIATGEERAAKVRAFARMLNAASGPVQISVRTVPVDLGVYADTVTACAGQLAHPALARAAADHALFLVELGQQRQLRERQILLTARRPVQPGRGGRDAAAGLAVRHLEDAAGLLATAGLRVRLLDAADAGRLLAACAQPDLPPPPVQATAAGVVRAAGAHR
ncbi:PrgI family protein [Frankia sp. B2]|uniref:PrgI family protein n=1 Tax=Frankia sp. B2 TaxID=2541730 RepID=UPI00106B9B91|nr:PrgI family protein [Frankia sp. B2]TFE31040.1 PrgI family protein [Frankia sp. B2]